MLETIDIIIEFLKCYATSFAMVFLFLVFLSGALAEVFGTVIHPDNEDKTEPQPMNIGHRLGRLHTFLKETINKVPWYRTHLVALGLTVLRFLG